MTLGRATNPTDGHVNGLVPQAFTRELGGTNVPGKETALGQSQAEDHLTNPSETIYAGDPMVSDRGPVVEILGGVR